MVNVKGHYRKSRAGNRVYVAPHSRNMPSYNGTPKMMGKEKYSKKVEVDPQKRMVVKRPPEFRKSKEDFGVPATDENMKGINGFVVGGRFFLFENEAKEYREFLRAEGKAGTVREVKQENKNLDLGKDEKDNLDDLPTSKLTSQSHNNLLKMGFAPITSVSSEKEAEKIAKDKYPNRKFSVQEFTNRFDEKEYELWIKQSGSEVKEYPINALFGGADQGVGGAKTRKEEIKNIRESFGKVDSEDKYDVETTIWDMKQEGVVEFAKSERFKSNKEIQDTLKNLERIDKDIKNANEPSSVQDLELYRANAIDNLRNMLPTKTKYYHAGKEVKFVEEVDSIDKAQALLDSYKAEGIQASALHDGNRHYVYAEDRAKAEKIVSMIEKEKTEKQKTIKWGFDLTGFRKASTFQSLLNRHGLTEYEMVYPYPEDKRYRRFVWSNKDGTLKIVTGNNPLTGEYTVRKQRKKERGYASYIGIEGGESKVIALKDDIKKTTKDIKDESKYEREFI